MGVCPSCGRELPGAFPFCPFCGAAIEAAPAREERKVVTAVFCDLVGSTARAERLDPEDVRALLSRYHERARAELERFGGTVEKFIGDAVVAVYGAPVAHEDDPERAVRAALAIREWAADEPDLHVRIAVNTGAALVSLGARPEAGEGIASGDVLNTAARLQSAAPVDGILVGEQTYRATERVIEYRTAEPVVAKGKAEPVPVWEVVQARSRLGVDVPRPGAAPLVGRERELALLAGVLDRASSERSPQLVTLVGVPGIGKSRLLAELVAEIERRGRLVTWRQGRSLPYGDGVSFWALGEIVKAQAGILETDGPDEAARKLEEASALLLPDEAEARWVASHLRPLAGLAAGDAASAERGGEAFAAWRRFFEALGELRPLVLAFEDLHWGDDGLLDFVDQLADRVADVPVLVVASARPELLARRPAWGGGKANATTISLAPLSEDETARLVHALLHRAALPAETQTALLERAGGNPLYAEEFVRMLAERDGATPELPESVQGIIAARLDAVSPEDKTLLQDAAVIGKVFWSGALANVSGRERYDVEERLHGLERRELVRRERHSSVAGETEYAFRHALVRDVAYGTIPRAARAERHRRAAEWVESLGRPDDHADLLAHHYLSALELARAAGVDAGVLAGSAAAALQRAGDRAYGLNSFASAIRYYDEALALGVAAAERPQILFRLGAALHFSGDERRAEVLEQAAEALLAAGDPETAAEATVLLSNAWWHRGRTDRSREEMERAQDLVRGRGASPAAARVLAQAASLAMVSDRQEEAFRLGTQALQMQEALGLADLMPSPLQTMASARARSGDMGDDVVADFERAIEQALAANSPNATRGYNNLAVVLWQRGEIPRAHTLLLEGKRVAERLGHGTMARFIDALLWLADYERGRWDDSLAGADAFLAGLEAATGHYQESAAHGVRARILLARDDPGAEREARVQLELGRALGDPQTLVPALSVAAYVYRELRLEAEARSALEEAIPFFRRGTSIDPKLAPLGLADPVLCEEMREALEHVPPSALLEDARAIVEGRLLEAADRLAAEGRTAVEAEVRLRAGTELAAAGRAVEADAQLGQALELFRSVGATRFVRACEAQVAAVQSA